MARDLQSDALIGATLDDRYRIEAWIGGGGMGSVFRGRHLMMDHEVAIKILRPDLAADPNAVRRFAREAKGSFRFDHPNCVRVFDFGFAAGAGVVYLVMEHLDGRTVGTELEVDGPLAAARVVHVARQVAAALAHAHAIGLVHRDLKPDNIMLLERDGDPDFAKVLDFGLAKLFEPDSSGTTIFSVAPLTQDGIVFGTPEYMSPEQATGQTLHPASDLYSLGAVMYQMLTGLVPFSGATFMATLTKQVREVPVAPSARRPDLGIPPELDGVVMRCLAKPVAARPQSAAALGAELAALAGKLAAAPSRVSPALAASDTMELSWAPGDRPLARPAPAAGAAASLDTMATEAVTSTTARARASRRGVALAAVISVALVVAILALVAGLRGDPASAPDAAPASPEVAVTRSAGSPDAGSPPAPPDAGSDADARSRPASSPRPRPRDPRVDQHVAAAAEARRSGNTLKQIAEADSALRLDRSSREAAFLLGDALVTSGDPERGCRYLAAARSLPEARARYQNAQCK